MEPYNPFHKQIKVDSRNVYLESLLFEATESICKIDIDPSQLEHIFTNGPVDFNPKVLTKSGELMEYQRPYVWTDEDRFRLLDTIYLNGYIGTFLFAENARFKVGDPSLYYDIIDGKQRLTTLINFVANQFPDRNNQYYKDFSLEARLRFRKFSNLGFQCLRHEDYNPASIKQMFLTVNTLGAPQSPEHISKVMSLDV